jgi:hypothetical protein
MDALFLFLTGMMGALAPLSSLVEQDSQKLYSNFFS